MPPLDDDEVQDVAVSYAKYPPGQTSGSATPSPPSDRFHLHTIDDILALPKSDWVIDGIVETDCIGFEYGTSGKGKTFLSIDLALCVATGEDWQGHRVKQGPVVYVVAEGQKNIRKRVRAWMQEHGVSDMPDAAMVLEAPQLRDPEDVDTLRQQIQAKWTHPALIVLDTFSQCFGGGEENSAKEVGEAIATARTLQQKTGATVLLVHHTGKGDNTDSERGSSALRGNVDFMMLVKMSQAGVITITNTKQKDQEAFEAISLQLKQVEVGTNDAGDPVTSCVLVAAGGGTPAAAAGGPTPLNASQQQALQALGGFDDQGAKSGDWRQAIATQQGDRSHREDVSKLARRAGHQGAG